MIPERLYTPNELSRLTSVPARRIREAIRTGALRAATFGSAWYRISFADFETWRQRTEYVPPPPPRDDIGERLAEAAIRRQARLRR